METLRKPFFYSAFAALVLALLIELSTGMIDFDIPGLGIPSIALIDCLLVFVIGMMLLNILVSPALIGKISGISTLIFSLLILFASIMLLVYSFTELFAMLALLLAVPFGTAAYLSLYASFARGEAAMILSLLILLKLVFSILLVLSNPRFLENKGLVLLIFTVLLVNILVGFLHGFPPGFLASITDALAAIIVALIGLIWSLNLLIRSLPAILKIT
jgi:VanZ family protein